MLSIIVAIDEQNGIGLNNQLLCHISADLKHFKQITTGKTVIMGRNTWLSLPRRPLPNRTNIVLTSDKTAVFEGAITANTVEQVLQHCPETEEHFIIGGASVYQQFLPLANKLYLTQIHKTFKADTFFPKIDPNIWQIVSGEVIHNDEQAGVTYAFIELERK